jgi:hypothetical protein
MFSAALAALALPAAGLIAAPATAQDLRAITFVQPRSPGLSSVPTLTITNAPKIVTTTPYRLRPKIYCRF